MGMINQRLQAYPEASIKIAVTCKQHLRQTYIALGSIAIHPWGKSHNIYAIGSYE